MQILILQLNSASHPSRVQYSFCWGKGRKVIAAGWQVTLCDPIMHVISTNCYIRFTYLLTSSGSLENSTPHIKTCKTLWKWLWQTVSQQTVTNQIHAPVDLTTHKVYGFTNQHRKVLIRTDATSMYCSQSVYFYRLKLPSFWAFLSQTRLLQM